MSNVLHIAPFSRFKTYNSRKISISGALVYIMNKFINLTIAILKPLIKGSKYYLKYCYWFRIHEATGLIVNLF